MTYLKWTRLSLVALIGGNWRRSWFPEVSQRYLQTNTGGEVRTGLIGLGGVITWLDSPRRGEWAPSTRHLMAVIQGGDTHNVHYGSSASASRATTRDAFSTSSIGVYTFPRFADDLMWWVEAAKAQIACIGHHSQAFLAQHLLRQKKCHHHRACCTIVTLMTRCQRSNIIYVAFSLTT